MNGHQASFTGEILKQYIRICWQKYSRQYKIANHAHPYENLKAR